MEIADGLYFDLSFEEYHAIPALSASGIKNLLISGPDFWYRSWFNPNRRDEHTEAMMLGRAFHARILEGRTKFYNRYALKFEAPDDCLRTVDDLKDALIKSGIEKPKGLKGDLIEQLLEVQPNAQIYDELAQDYAVLHHGKEFLSHDIIASIEIAAAMIEKHPHISKCFQGGYPEVSVVWTESDCRFKARFDYLKPKSIIDLKTFSNTMNKPVDNAIYGAMASGKYHIQAAFYLRAVQAAKTLAKPVDFPGPNEWLRDFTDCQEHGFYFVFQQKGIAPLARAKKFPRNSVWQVGVVAIEQAIEKFKLYREKYGDGLWIDVEPIDEFEDSNFPVYAMEL